MVESPVLPGEVLAGKYRIERVLSSGPLSVVVLAWHLDLEQRVAIKFLQAETDRRFDATGRFRREARATAKVTSEHVARVLDVGRLANNTPYIVMEYLEGATLNQEIRYRGPLPIGEAVGYVLQAVDALAEVHALGIVHRDLKPGNLFLTRKSDGKRLVKVLDFGISKLSASALQGDVEPTRAELFVGSPQYMSPEQISSAADVDARADIWSLGAVLYKMLTGRPPFVAMTVPLLCASVLRDTPPRITEIRPTVPPGLEAVIARCLSKDREQRYASVEELRDALSPFAAPSLTSASLAPVSIPTSSRPSRPNISINPRSTPRSPSMREPWGTTTANPTSLATATPRTGTLTVPVIIPLDAEEDRPTLSPDAKDAGRALGPPPGRSRRGLFIGLGAAAAALLVVVLATRSRHGAPHETSAASRPSDTLVERDNAEASEAPAMGELPTAAPPPAAPREPAGAERPISSEPGELDKPHAARHRGHAGATVAPGAPVVTPPAAATAPAPQPEPASPPVSPPAPAQTSGDAPPLTDFGGRR